MSEKSMKKEFHMEIDDLVDDLLSSITQNGWSVAKMQYEVGTLSAKQDDKKVEDGKPVAVTYELTATWQDFGDALELEVVVKDAANDFTEAECAQKCAAILDSIVDKKSYENLFPQDSEFLFDEFESNN